jgi:hypothetical protein
MPRQPIRLYASLLECVEGGSESERVATVRRALRAANVPEDLRAFLAREGIGSGYVLRHLLSIHRFAPDVRAALEAGLPLSVARMVNRLADAAARSRALEPLATLNGPKRALLPEGVSRSVERRARAELLASAPRARGAVGATEEGWLPAQEGSAPPEAMGGNVWTFPPSSPERDPESLHPKVIEAMLERILPAGGRLVDVTAAAGAIARVAARHRVATWSGDLAPGAGFVRRADARSLLADSHPGLGRAVADALVVHPPTFPAWQQASDPHRMRGLEGYADDVGAMVAGSLGVVRPGGSVVLVTRPVREAHRVWLTTSHLAEILEDGGLVLTAYIVAVADDGTEDWHVLLAEVPRVGEA